MPITCHDCQIVAGENPSVMELQLCPLHAAAGQLRDACRAVVGWMRLHPDTDPPLPSQIDHLLATALAAAEAKLPARPPPAGSVADALLRAVLDAADCLMCDSDNDDPCTAHEDHGDDCNPCAVRRCLWTAAKAAGAVVEHFDHDDCPECGTPSVPYEGVPDQALRGCPKCEHQWWENLDEPPQKAAQLPGRGDAGVSV